MELTDVYRDEAVALGSWRNIYLCVWNGPMSSLRLAQARKTLAGLERKFPGRHGSLVVVRSGMPLAVEPSLRAEMEALRRDFGGRKTGIAQVIEGAGFWAAAVRAVLVGLELVRTQRAPTKIFEHTSTAAQWLVPLSKPEIGIATPEQLLAALETLQQTTGPSR